MNSLDFLAVCCRANSAHVRQSRPDSGLGFQVKVFKLFQGVPSSLGSGGCSSLCVDTGAWVQKAASWLILNSFWLGSGYWRKPRLTPGTRARNHCRFLATGFCSFGHETSESVQKVAAPETAEPGCAFAESWWAFPQRGFAGTHDPVAGPRNASLLLLLLCYSQT